MRTALAKAADTEKALSDSKEELAALQAKLVKLDQAEAKVVQLAAQVSDLESQLEAVSLPWSDRVRAHSYRAVRTPCSACRARR